MFCISIGQYPYFRELRAEVGKLLNRVKFSDKIPNQLSLQVKNPSFTGPDSWFTSIGRIDGPERKIIEEEYIHTHPRLVGSHIDGWIQSVTGYKIARTRLMLVPPRTCYSIHKDPRPRIHIAIKTNPSSLIVFPEHEKLYNLPADGSTWFVDTRESHTVINCSIESRIHLVGVVVD